MSVKTKLTIGFVVALSMILLSAPVHAQGRQGINFGIGAGVGGLQATSEDFDAETAHELGGALNMRLGFAFTNNIILSGDIILWFQPAETSDYTIYDIVANLTGYFYVYEGLNIHAGFGFAEYGVAYDGAAMAWIEGLDINIGAGYGFQIGGIELGPRFDFVYSYFPEQGLDIWYWTIGLELLVL